MRHRNLFLTLALLAVPPHQANAQNVETQWLGDAPFCQAQKNQCSAKNMTFVRKHPSGDGETCLTGYKVLCEGKTVSAATSPSQACPTTARNLEGTTSCQCNGSQTGSGSIWGSADYTADSRICRAAVHAGVIPLSGGAVRVTIRPGKSSYRGTTANGVKTGSWKSYPKSFRISK